MDLQIILPDSSVAPSSEFARACLPAEDHLLFDQTIDRFADRGYTKGTLYLDDRNDSGWLEYTLHLFKDRERRMVVGCIQRRPGAEPEFHS